MIPEQSNDINLSNATDAWKKTNVFDSSVKINNINFVFPKLPDYIINQLKVPLPSESISQHPTKPYLSTIKAIYVVERLNDVFGINGWFINNTVIESTGKMIVIESTLTVPMYGIRITSFGGNDNIDRGDAYKGACTDALTKIASYMYIGMDVFKGLVKPDNSNKHISETKIVPSQSISFSKSDTSNIKPSSVGTLNAQNIRDLSETKFTHIKL